MTINSNRPELDGYYVLRDKMNDRRHWDSSHPEYESYNAEIRKGFEELYGSNAGAKEGEECDPCKCPRVSRMELHPEYNWAREKGDVLVQKCVMTENGCDWVSNNMTHKGPGYSNDCYHKRCRGVDYGGCGR